MSDVVGNPKDKFSRDAAHVVIYIQPFFSVSTRLREKIRGLEAVLMSTHNLCFRAKIRKHLYHCKPQFDHKKVGSKGVNILRTC